MRQPAALIVPRSSALGGTGTEAGQADRESAGGAHERRRLYLCRLCPSGEFRQIVIRNQRNRLGPQGGVYTRIAQNGDFLFSLGHVHARRIPVNSGMTSDLRNPPRERPDDADQTVDADRGGVRMPFSGLSVELATIHDLGVRSAHRNAEPIGKLGGDRACRASSMHMLMRIDVRGLAPDETAKRFELAPDLATDRCEVIRIHDL